MFGGIRLSITIVNDIVRGDPIAWVVEHIGLYQSEFVWDTMYALYVVKYGSNTFHKWRKGNQFLDRLPSIHENHMKSLKVEKND